GRAHRLPARNLFRGDRFKAPERPIEAGDDVVRLLETNADPHDAIDAGAFELLAWSEILRDGDVVVHLGREPVEAQRVAWHAGHDEDVGEVARRVLVRAIDAEGEERSREAIGAFDHRAIRVRRERWVEDLGDARMASEEVRDARSVRR